MVKSYKKDYGKAAEWLIECLFGQETSTSSKLLDVRARAKNIYRNRLYKVYEAYRAKKFESKKRKSELNLPLASQSDFPDLWLYEDSDSECVPLLDEESDLEEEEWFTQLQETPSGENISTMPAETQREFIIGIRDELKRKCQIVNCSFSHLIGSLMMSEYWHKDRALGKVGKAICQGESVLKELSFEEALWLREECELSSNSYKKMVGRFREHKVYLPSWDKMYEELLKIRPKLTRYSVPGSTSTGPAANLRECLTLTLGKDL